MENTINYPINRSDVERVIGNTITDEQWKTMAEELVDALAYYFYDEIPRLWADIDSLMSE